MEAEKRILLHCDAGRDRTGTFSALLAAMTAEQQGLMDQRIIDAIECDYQKSRSLTQDKYGRMERFLLAILKQGSFSSFIQSHCSIPEERMTHASQTFLVR